MGWRTRVDWWDVGKMGLWSSAQRARLSPGYFSRGRHEWRAAGPLGQGDCPGSGVPRCTQGAVSLQPCRLVSRLSGETPKYRYDLSHSLKWFSDPPQPSRWSVQA